jgi:hypothetical protein
VNDTEIAYTSLLRMYAQITGCYREEGSFDMYSGEWRENLEDFMWPACRELLALGCHIFPSTWITSEI